MRLADHINPQRCMQLVTGVAGIYFSYLVSGVVHQSMLKKTYTNDNTGVQEKFTWAAGFLIFPCGMTYLFGALVNYFTIPAQQKVAIPAKNAAICGLTVCISTMTYTFAIYLTNYPVVMMFKSCNILSVILVGVLCSRVKDKKLKLGMKKIIVGIIVTLGIILFKVMDPNSFKDDGKKTQLVGIVLLIVSLLADGFLPDFQAEIKSQYKPQPMEMMVQINKWVTIISIVYSCLVGFQIYDMTVYLFTHTAFLIHMLEFCILSFLGQMFVYRMIKQFKQHFVPFVITTRKIFTVGLSILYYHHATNMFQISGLLLVFLVVTFEFVTELMSEKKEEHAASISEQNIDSANREVTLADRQVEDEIRQRQNQKSPDVSDQLKKEEQIYNKRMTGELVQDIEKDNKEIGQ